MIKCIELSLPIFKQGDDLQMNIEKSSNYSEAMINYSTQLQEAANILTRFSKLIENKDVTIRGDTHCIFIEGEEDIINKLIEQEPDSIYEYDTDEEIDEYDDDYVEGEEEDE